METNDDKTKHGFGYLIAWWLLATMMLVGSGNTVIVLQQLFEPQPNLGWMALWLYLIQPLTSVVAAICSVYLIVDRTRYWPLVLVINVWISLAYLGLGLPAYGC